MADQQPNPLFEKFDQALHKVTEQFRKDHPDYAFSYRADVRPIQPQKPTHAIHQTQIVKK